MRSPGLGLSLFWNIFELSTVHFFRNFWKIFYIILSVDVFEQTWPVKYGRKLSACTRVAKSMNPDTFNVLVVFSCTGGANLDDFGFRL